MGGKSKRTPINHNIIIDCWEDLRAKVKNMCRTFELECLGEKKGEMIGKVSVDTGFAESTVRMVVNRWIKTGIRPKVIYSFLLSL